MEKFSFKRKLVLRLLALLMASLIIFSEVFISNTFTAYADTEYHTVLDFEESTITDSVLKIGNGLKAVNKNTSYVKTGEQSAMVTLSGAWTNVKIYASSENFAGEGLRFFIFGSSNLNKADLYLIIDGATKKLSFRPNVNDWTVVDYSLVGLTENEIANIDGIQINFMNSSATGAVYYIDTLQIERVDPNTYKSIRDFEENSIQNSVLTTGNAAKEINTASSYVKSGTQSIKITLSAAWSNVKVYAAEENFYGDGIRFYIFGEGNLDKAELYLIINGTSVKTSVKPTVNGWTILNYEELGISNNDSRKISGIQLNFMNTSATSAVYYLDSLELINPKVYDTSVYKSVYDFEDSITSSSSFKVSNATAEINTSSAFVKDGSQSAKVTLSTAWSNVKIYGNKGEFYGEGIRFYVFGEGNLDKAELYLIINNISKKVSVSPSINDYTIINFAEIGLTEEEIKNLSGVHLNFMNSKATNDTYYVDSLEVINPKTYLSVTDITKNSVSFAWELFADSEITLWYSESELTADNLASANKTLATTGNNLNTATVSGLKEKTTYYFALSITTENGIETLFASATPFDFVYDFEKFDNLSQYIVKTDNRGVTFINGGYGCTTEISKDNVDGVNGNSLKMTWGDFTGTADHPDDRWPILYIFAPNYGDFAGDGFSIRVAKTKNDKNESIRVPVRVEIYLDDKTTYQLGDYFGSSVFPQDKDSNLLTFNYEEFSLSTDTTVKFNKKDSDKIIAIRFFFAAKISECGKFSLYFDELKVENRYVVSRPIEDIYFLNKSVTLQEGSAYSQVPTITPFNAVENELVWTSNKTEVATVDQTSGLVTAVKMGIATITATAPSGVSASYKVVIKEDERGMLYRTLFAFDDGEIPASLQLSGFTASLDYVKSEQATSLKLVADSKATATFSVPDYMFYGEGVSLWLLGENGGYATIVLKTKSGKSFTADVQVDPTDGISMPMDYELFKNGGKSPTKDEIIDIVSISIIYNGTIFVDNIKVKDPIIYNVKVEPQSETNIEGVVCEDINDALSEVKYIYTNITEGADYDWALSALSKYNLYSVEEEVWVSSLYFVDKDNKESNISKPVRFIVPIPENLMGYKNIWVVHIDNKGNITGKRAEVSLENVIFNADESGIYCFIGRNDNEGFEFKVKSEQTVEKEGETITIVKKRKKKVNDDSLITIEVEWWMIVLCSIGFVLIVGGIVFLIVKKRKNKRKQVTSDE